MEPLYFYLPYMLMFHNNHFSEILDITGCGFNYLTLIVWMGRN